MAYLNSATEKPDGIMNGEVQQQEAHSATLQRKHIFRVLRFNLTHYEFVFVTTVRKLL